MKRVLITGIAGFAGSHLAEFLVNNKLAEVFGTIHNANASTENLQAIKEKIKTIECNITDFVSVENAIKETQPEIIFHLAAKAIVSESISHPAETLNTNVNGTINILEAIRKSGLNPTMQLASSGEVYGFALEKELPLRETSALRPLNPYAVSKAAMDLFAFQYFKMYGLQAIVTRAFNHSGPRQAEQFVISNWAKQVATIEKGLQEPVILTGDLRNSRDFSDVRDVVRAYWLAATKGKAGETYNVCSGKTVALKQLFSIFSRQAKKKISPKVDEAKIRQNDLRTVKASYAKLKSVTEWKPEIPLQKTVADTINYWRARV